MMNNSFIEYTKQSAKGIIFIFMKELIEKVKHFWVLIPTVLISNKKGKSLLFILIVLLILFVIVLLFSILKYHNFKFKIKNHYFILKRGILNKTTTSIPFHKIQHIHTHQNIVQQLLGVYEVKLETIGDDRTEVTINALSKESVVLLKKEIYTNLSKKIIEENNISQQLLKITPKDLVKISISENHFKSFIILVTLTFSFFSRIRDYIDLKSEDLNISISNWFMFILFCIITSILFSSIIIFTKFANFKLKIKDKNIEISRGYFNKKNLIFKHSKIQLLLIKTNPIKKLFNFCTLVLKQPHDQKTSKKNNPNDEFNQMIGTKLLEIPGANKHLKNTIKKYLFQKEDIKFKHTYKPDPYYFKWMIIKLFQVLFIINTLISMFVIFIKDTPTTLYFINLIIPNAILMIYIRYKKTFFQFNQTCFRFYTGVFENNDSYLYKFKVQSAELKQSFFQKKKKLYNLIIYTASGSVRIPCIHQKLAFTLYNDLINHIENNQKKWM